MVRYSLQGLLYQSTTNCLAPVADLKVKASQVHFFWSFSPWPVSLCHPPCVGLCAHVSSSNKDTGHTGLGPTHECILTELPLSRPPSVNAVIVRYWGQGLQHMNLQGGDAVLPVTVWLLTISYICVGSSLTKDTWSVMCEGMYSISCLCVRHTEVPALTVAEFGSLGVATSPCHQKTTPSFYEI